MPLREAEFGELYRAGVPVERLEAGKPVEVGACGSHQGGHTALGRKNGVVRIVVPNEGNAASRTIQLHELLHARYSIKPPSRKGKVPMVAQQAIEDCRVHREWWPMGAPVRVHRDALASALQDVRALSRGIKLKLTGPSDHHNWPITLLCAVRALATADKVLSVPGSAESSGIAKRARGVLKRLEGAMGRDYARGLYAIARDASSGVTRLRNKATKAFVALLPDPPPVPVSRPDGIKRQVVKPSPGKGCAATVPMLVVDLPKSAPCIPGQARRLEAGSSGNRLNFPRVAQSLAGLDASALFDETRRRRPGRGFSGVVLIDASSSMDVSSERLAHVCAAIPGATVAYYSGPGGLPKNVDGVKVYGVLAVYARGGIRHSCKSAPFHESGNEVDLWAVKWLLSQPGKRLLVTDGGYCGGCDNQAQAAAALVQVSEKTGALEVVASIDDLVKRFGIKED